MFQKFFAVFSLTVIFLSCQTTRKITPPIEINKLEPYQLDEIKWQNIDIGIDLFSFKNKKHKVMYEVVRIDLTNGYLNIFNMKSKNEWQKSTTVKAFAKKNNADIAINTSPFYIKTYILPWSKSKPCGIVLSEGKVLVEPNERYCGIAFYKNTNGWRAKIFDNQKDILTNDANDLREACGGFWTILRNGQIRQFENIKDVRSAVATANDGKVLYLFAGKNLTYMECAEIFLRLNADVAMQFDGGSSTQLVIKNKNRIPQSIQRSVCAILGFSVTDQSNIQN